MPSQIPRSVRNAWGEEATEDFADWFNQAIRESAVPRDEYREVLSRLDVVDEHLEQVDERLNRIDGRFDRIDECLNRIDGRFDRIDERFDQMHERFDEMSYRMLTVMRWTVGVVALIGTIVTVLLAIAEFAA